MTTLPLSRRSLLLATLAGGAACTFDLRGLTAAEAAAKLKVLTKSPLNAEPELANLVENAITPVEHFYVRNHGPIPEVKGADHRLTIEGLVERPQKLALGELQEKFKPQSGEATLTCAGNRREEMSAIKPVGGVQWSAGAIGHARWEGVSLAEVLKSAGLRDGAKHVWFEGLDPIKEKDGSQAPFGGSIPLEKARHSGTLLAQKMNGEPLTPEHGFPLRTIVPGFIGARSVKWLTKITVSDRPSPNHYVAEAYKIVTSDDKAELARQDPIYEFPINAAICFPGRGAKLKAGKHTVSGYALPSGSDAQIEKVEVSLDGGKRWFMAKLRQSEQPRNNWCLWSCDVELTAATDNLTVRATDSRGNVQPKTTPWNVKGYLYNAWHRVDVEVA